MILSSTWNRVTCAVFHNSHFKQYYCMLHAGSWQGSINLVASTSFKPQQQRLSILAIKNTSPLRAPDFKSINCKDIEKSQATEDVPVNQTGINLQNTDPQGRHTASWLWCDRHTDSAVVRENCETLDTIIRYKTLPEKVGHFKKDSQRSHFRSSALFYAPVGAGELAFSYCSPPTESSPW